MREVRQSGVMWVTTYFGATRRRHIHVHSSGFGSEVYTLTGSEWFSNDNRTERVPSAARHLTEEQEEEGGVIYKLESILTMLFHKSKQTRAYSP